METDVGGWHELPYGRPDELLKSPSSDALGIQHLAWDSGVELSKHHSAYYSADTSAMDSYAYPGKEGMSLMTGHSPPGFLQGEQTVPSMSPEMDGSTGGYYSHHHAHHHHPHPPHAHLHAHQQPHDVAALCGGEAPDAYGPSSAAAAAAAVADARHGHQLHAASQADYEQWQLQMLSQADPYMSIGLSSGPGSKRKRRRVITHDQRKAANIRERRRMYHLNESFDILRKRVPTFAYEKKLSRIETLKLAVTYIEFMSELLENNGEKCKEMSSALKKSKNKEKASREAKSEDSCADLTGSPPACNTRDSLRPRQDHAPPSSVGSCSADEDEDLAPCSPESEDFDGETEH